MVTRSPSVETLRSSSAIGSTARPCDRRQEGQVDEGSPREGSPLSEREGGDHGDPVTDGRVVQPDHPGRAGDRGGQGRRRMSRPIPGHLDQVGVRRLAGMWLARVTLQSPPSARAETATRTPGERRCRRALNSRRAAAPGWRSTWPEAVAAPRTEVQPGGGVEHDPDRVAAAGTPRRPAGTFQGKLQHRLARRHLRLHLDDARVGPRPAPAWPRRNLGVSGLCDRRPWRRQGSGALAANRLTKVAPSAVARSWRPRRRRGSASRSRPPPDAAGVSRLQPARRVDPKARHVRLGV
jgi:hypothetical protein